MTQTRTRAPVTGTRPPRLEPRGSVKLTGRGAVIALFLATFLSLLFAAWTGWSAAADAIFVLACGVVAYYTRAKGLRNVVVTPPLAFAGGTVCAELITAPDLFSAAEGILVTLGTSAPWLFAGTALTIAIAFGRGYRPSMVPPAALPVIDGLIDAVRSRTPSRSRRKDQYRKDRWSRGR
jgi:hypothetical protein